MTTATSPTTDSDRPDTGDRPVRPARGQGPVLRELRPVADRAEGTAVTAGAGAPDNAEAGDVPAGGAGRAADGPSLDHPLKARVVDLSFWYGSFKALKGIDLPVGRNKVTALIGPSGCGKSTLLRCFNRMHDLYPHHRYAGRIDLLPDGTNIVGPKVDPIEVRMRISMVFQKPNPFPKTIFENVAYGLRVRGERNRSLIEERVESALRGAALWDETKDRLHESGMALSGGQQQRLCIARALATDPEIILFDEPTSALDPIATARIEELVNELRAKVTILIVTHNMQQAARISDYTAFMYIGELIEFDKTDKMFTNPGKKLTEEYITGRFG